MESWSNYISNGNSKGLVSTSVVESQSSSISRTGFMNWVSDQQQQDTGPSFAVPQLIRQQQVPPPNPMMTVFSEDSNSIVKSGIQDSPSLIDLKLGRRLEDYSGSKLVQRHPILCCSGPAKRPRVAKMKYAAAYCQVYGCNKDLSSSKDYHKRHKVCDLHSKTPTVIVNGIQQRFCQQCSRFHLLAEFDDGKRSCRKRLAGHNERRRKTHGGAHSGRLGKLPQPVNNGNKPQETIFTPTSFICQGIMPPTCLPNPNIKAENYCTFSATPIPNAQSRTPILPYTIDKHLPFFQASSSSMGSAGFSGFTTGISDPGSALSLLSSPSRSSSTHSSGFPIAQTLIGMAEPLCHLSSPTEQILLRGMEEDGPTISLSQLSLRLQRVESQRQSLETMQEFGGICRPRIA